MIEVKIANLIVDTKTNLPVITLQELGGSRILPIVIGLAEARAIAAALEDMTFPRPMTHDLFYNTLTSLGQKLVNVAITELRENTFYAVMELSSKQQKTQQLDCRPSDAIALAVRSQAPIYVSNKVFLKLDGHPSKTKPDPRPVIVPNTQNDESLKEFLENLQPEEFGKYKM